MKDVEFYRWWLPPDIWGKKPRLSTYRMTREEAQRRFPGIEPDLTSLEVRSVPEDDGEALRTQKTGRMGHRDYGLGSGLASAAALHSR